MIILTSQKHNSNSTLSGEPGAGHFLSGHYSHLLGHPHAVHIVQVPRANKDEKLELDFQGHNRIFKTLFEIKLFSVVFFSSLISVSSFSFLWCVACTRCAEKVQCLRSRVQRSRVQGSRVRTHQEKKMIGCMYFVFVCVLTSDSPRQDGIGAFVRTLWEPFELLVGGNTAIITHSSYKYNSNCNSIILLAISGNTATVTRLSY